MQEPIKWFMTDDEIDKEAENITEETDTSDNSDEDFSDQDEDEDEDEDESPEEE